MKAKLIFGSALTAIALISNVYAADAVSAAQQKQIEDVVHRYLVAHPEVIVESIQTLQKRQMDEATKTVENTQKNAPKYVNNLFHQANDPIAGNANGKITIVDFFDYQCAHCIKMTPIMEALVKSNPNVRIVFKEFPIRGPVSEFAAKAALAAKMQGKYFEFHKEVMKQSEQKPLTEEIVLTAASSVGLDVNKLKSDMKGAAIDKQIKDNYKLAQDLKLMGTPAFFIAESNITNNPAAKKGITFIPGQADQKQFEDILGKM